MSMIDDELDDAETARLQDLIDCADDATEKLMEFADVAAMLQVHLTKHGNILIRTIVCRDDMVEYYDDLMQNIGQRIVGYIHDDLISGDKPLH